MTDRSPLSRCVGCGTPVSPLPWSLPDRMFGEEGRFRFGRCSRCRTLLLLDPPDDLGRHYPDDRYYSYGSAAGPSTSSAPPASPEQRVRRLTPRRLTPRYRPVEQELTDTVHSGRSPRVLDVGCGDGRDLDLFARLGWETFGVEIGTSAVRQARARGHRVEQGPFDAFRRPPEGGFDLVRLRHVLEHLPDPPAALRRAFELLEPEGRILIEVPNPGGWLARLAGAYYWQLDPPRHLVLLSKPALEGLLVRAGFRIEISETYSWGKGAAHSFFFWWTSRRGRSAWRLSDRTKPRGHGRVRRSAEPLALVSDLFRRGDNLRLIARRPAGPEDGPGR